MERALRPFLAIAETQNLTAAADRLGITQSALTKILRRLEQDVGAKLFDRHPRGMTLTPFGEAFRRRARTIQLELRFAAEEIDALKRGHQEVFRIGAGPLYHLLYLPRIIPRLADRFGKTRFELTTDVNTALLPMLSEGKIDAVFGRIEPAEELVGVVTIPLTEVETVVIARQGHPLAGRRLTDLSPLLDFRWILYQRDLESGNNAHAYFLRSGMEAPKFSIQTTSFAAGLRMLAESDLLMSAPSLLQPFITEAGLTVLELPEPFWRFRSGAWIRGSSVNYPVVQSLLALAKAECFRLKH
jgi:DNA-binding transcriptional LysR family regulator